MPPKPKFEKEKIIEVSLDIVRESGAEGLTARNIGKRLGSSARPIFTVFANMEELKSEVFNAAMKLYNSYIEVSAGNLPMFKKAGMQMIIFSRNEPRLFRFLFMSQNKGAVCFDDVFAWLGKTAEYCIDILCNGYGFDPQTAHALFESVWIYTYGVSCLCATGMCQFTDEQISKMLSSQFMASLNYIKSGKAEEK